MHGMDARMEARVMGEWYTSPLVWTGALSLSAVAVGIIFGLGQWKGKVDSDRDTFKRTLDAFMVEIRADIKRIFERLPPTPQSIASGSPLRLTALGQSISDELDVSEWATQTAPDLLHRAQGMTALQGAGDVLRVRTERMEAIRRMGRPYRRLRLFSGDGAEERLGRVCRRTAQPIAGATRDTGGMTPCDNRCWIPPATSRARHPRR